MLTVEELVYLDNAATTACAPEVIDAMLPFFTKHFANASSIDHSAGTFARRAVEESRQSIAALLDSRPEDVIFTSGSTEANNLVLSIEGRVLTTRIEHPSVLEPFSRRHRTGDAQIPTDSNGCIDLLWLRSALAPKLKPTLVSVIATNNEIGTEQDVAALGQMSRDFGAMLHLDATQAILTRELSLKRNKIDAISISAHKFHGPKGVGALIADSAIRRLLVPLSRGGGQERDLRSGTLNVPGIVGFGAAARLLVGEIAKNRDHFTKLRKAFLGVLNSKLPDQTIETVYSAFASPHILSVRFACINSRALLGAVSEKLAFSLGAACATNKSEPSHVLLALGLQKHEIAETVRFSFSRYQEVSQVEQAAEMIARAISSLRDLTVHH